MSKLQQLKRPPVEIEDAYIPKDVERAVWKRDCGRCIICGADDDIQMEHRVPRAQGGRNTVDNLRLMCNREACHKAKTKIDAGNTADAKRKGAKDRGEWRKSKTPMRSRGFPKGGPKQVIKSRGLEKKKPRG